MLPEFAFIGRSNCGKSSLINHFLGRQDLARTSGTPGKTRLLNYYAVDGRYYVVDLPGYGYAKVAKTQRAAWRGLFQAYLGAQDRPLAVFHLLDARIRPTADDREVCRLDPGIGAPLGPGGDQDRQGGHQRAPRPLPGDHRRAGGSGPDTPFFPTSARLGRGADGRCTAWVEALLDAAGRRN